MASVEIPDNLDPKELEKFLSQISKTKTLEEEPIIFAEVQTTDTQMLKVSRNVYKGKESFRIQNFWKDEEHPNWQFGKAVTFHHENLEELIEGLQKMKEWCEENPGKED